MKIVVKIGGSLLEDLDGGPLLPDIAKLSRSANLVLVHGGGDKVTEVATKLGKEQRFIVSPSGMKSRYTDSETVEIYQMVMNGLIGKRLVSSLRRLNVSAVSLSGTDGGLLEGIRKKRLLITDERGRKLSIEGGYTGRIRSVNSHLLDLISGGGHLPVISPVAVGEEAESLNVDGDRAASSVAVGIRADAVVFATNVDGLALDGEVVSALTPEEARERLPSIGFGMQKKVIAAADAVEGGVKEAVICSGRKGSPISKALAHEGCTVVSRR